MTEENKISRRKLFYAYILGAASVMVSPFALDSCKNAYNHRVASLEVKLKESNTPITGTVIKEIESGHNGHNYVLIVKTDYGDELRIKIIQENELINGHMEQYFPLTELKADISNGIRISFPKGNLLSRGGLFLNSSNESYFEQGVKYGMKYTHNIKILEK